MNNKYDPKVFLTCSHRVPNELQVIYFYGSEGFGPSPTPSPPPK